jgi:putative membrane protein
MTVNDLPILNASLNATATVLITSGFILIKRGRIGAHRKVMTTAMVVSALFLVSYLTYHGMKRGLHTEFGGHGPIRTVYLVILWTHIPLAALIAVIVPRTFLLAINGEFERHKAWARWTFPIWYYVSVTGVLVYLFLYQWWPAAK